MLKQLLTTVLLGILLIDTQAQSLTPPAGTVRLGKSLAEAYRKSRRDPFPMESLAR